MKGILFGRGYWSSILKKYLLESGIELVLEVDTNTPEMDIEQALMDTEVGFVCTPVPTHYKIVKMLLGHGLHVFCEKILTESVGQTEELLQLAKNRGRVLFTDYTYLYSQGIDWLRKERKRIGDIYKINADISQYGKFYKNANALNTIGVHLLSAIHYILEEYHVPISENNLAQNGQLEMNDWSYNGKLGTVSLCIRCSLLSNIKTRQIQIVGKKGIISYNMMSKETVVLQSYNGKRRVVHFDESNNLRYALESFFGAINAGGEEQMNPLITTCVVKDLENVM